MEKKKARFGFCQEPKGLEGLTSPCYVRDNFHRQGWALGVLCGKPRMTETAGQGVLVTFADRLYKVLNATHSEVAAFHEAYEGLVAAYSAMEDLICFMAQAEHFYFMTSGDAELLRIREENRTEKLSSKKRPAEEVLESGFSCPRVDVEMIEDDDLCLVAGNSNLLNALKPHEIREIVLKYEDAQEAADALVGLAKRFIPEWNYSVVVVSLK